MVGLFNYNPSLVADPQRQQGFGAVDPMGAMMGLMAMNQAFNKKPRYTTSISEATAPDDSGMQTAMGLMNYQRQAQRDRLLAEQQARQQRMDDLKVDEYRRGVTKEKEWADAAASGDQARMMDVYKRHDPKGWWASQQKDQTPITVAPGATMVDRSGKPIFTAPAKPENEPEHLRLMRAAGIDPETPQGKQMLTTYLNSKGDKPTNELYYDPNSPTGTRYARSNLPGPPQSGIDVEMGPDGKVARLRQGAQMPGAGGAAGLEKTVRSDNQKQLLGLGERMMELGEIERRFQPQFHQWGTRLGAGIKDLRDKTGLDALKLSPQEAQGLAEMRDYQAGVGKTMSEIRHEMFGSALTKTESSKADEYIINSDDSPTTAQAKLKSFKELTTKAMARRKYADANGLDWNNVALDKMPQVIRERGDYLSKLVKMKNRDADEATVRESVKRQLAIEFGFAQ